MVENFVVSGKIIEQRGHVVITVQGGVISSYDLRYYKLPDIEGLEESASEEVNASSPVLLSKWRRRAFSPNPSNDQKSANRA
ncbi:hypothetical protein [Saccharibacillus sp. JS10]|uniref:hypothetical protein n=1 Tax=Saccharibacillus sp. JS10 TaxID=2950552 RepID=UPI00210B6B7C|nr:hypothetical protein [Saccharibacillus sp. JS10]MCQ4087382.1 hypothetical protein [Saccharibacillus sp. JS10]